MADTFFEKFSYPPEAFLQKLLVNWLLQMRWNTTNQAQAYLKNLFFLRNFQQKKPISNMFLTHPVLLYSRTSNVFS